MNAHRRSDMALILVGDILAMGLSLWAAIAVRIIDFPSWGLLALHIFPFGILFFLSLIVFYVSGLYQPHTLVLKGRTPTLLLNASFLNALLGLGLFYFFPYVGISPKTTLLLYLAFSFVLLAGWRFYGGMALGFRRKEPAVLIGGGEEMEQLVHAVNTANFYGIEFVKTFHLDTNPGMRLEDEFIPLMKRTLINTVVVDLGHPALAPLLPRLQEYQFRGVKFLDQSRVYEDMFDKVPLSLIGYAWILEHASSRVHFGYDLLKRLTDIVFALVLLVISLPLYPFVILATFLESGRPIFFFQDRVGEQNLLFTIIKFRTMRIPAHGERIIKDHSRITQVGRFLRMTRIDELPQLWNVIVGDLSLIGPRPELPDLVRYYNAVIPYYNVRHLVKPGLSGWAQVHHEKPPQSVEETKEKLAYDLYYIKNRSFMLDLKIALKTVRTLLSRTGA